MALNHKVGLITAILLVALVFLGLALYARQKSQSAHRKDDAAKQSAHGDASPTPPVSNNSSPAIPAPPIAAKSRHDADYWPQQPHSIALKGRNVMPSRSFDAVTLLDTAKHVWLAQFGGPMTAANAAELRQRYRIEPLSPSAEMCFYVRATAADLAEATDMTTPALLGWVRLDAADKVLDAGFPRNAAPAQMRVELFSGGDSRRVAGRVVSLGGRVLRAESNWIGIERAQPYEFALALAELDDVYSIEPGRSKLIPHNAEAEANSRATPLFSAPFNLTGDGVTVMVRDEGRIFAHPDFDSRLLFGPDVTGLMPVQHATHVAGTIGGSGISIPAAGARGFAPGCSIVSYDLNGDESAEPLQALQMFGAVISNHSYGFLTGWDDATGNFTDNQATFGTYSSFARNWDNLVRTQNLILIKSAGNLRDGNGPLHPHNGTLAADGEYYNTVDSSGTSKNVLVVGAVSDSAVAGTPNTTKFVMPFSSSGPTSDGRLRPEIVANGDTLLSCDNTPVTGNVYVSLSGTSMAAAAATGATVLFMQRYKQLAGPTAACAPHFLRAVYAQTATDFGTPGPDFLHGFGMLDALAAVTMLNADGGTGSRLVSSSVSAATPVRFFALTTDGSTPIKGTLCWTDDPGDPLAAKTLVNDLDLSLIKADDQTTTFPFTLSASAPQLPAKQGINSVDTIEQVILAPAPAGNYVFAIRGTTLLSSTSFALASSHAAAEVMAPVASIVSNATTGPPPLTVNFDGSGSTAAPGETILQYIWTFGDGASASGAMVQHAFNQGAYQVILKVIDNKGASATASMSILADTKPPVAVLSASPVNGSPPLNVNFSAAGSTDPNGKIVSFALDFGDGTTGSGSNVTHAYSVPGLFTARLTVMDNVGLTASKITTVYVGDTFTPQSAHFSLNFKKNSADSFSLSTRKLPIAATVNTTGLNGTIRVGLATYNFILDSKGVYTSPVLKVRLVPAHGQLTVTLATTNLLGALAVSNVSNTTVSKQTVLIPFAITLDGPLSFGSPGLPFSFTAKQGVSGIGMFLKN